MIVNGAVMAGLSYGAPGQVPWTVALFALPPLYAVPATRPGLVRHWWLVLIVQGALTWIPLAVFGSPGRSASGGCWPRWRC